MAEYLSPGVITEEYSYRNSTIEGLGTSTAAFVGPTRYGPIKGDPELLSSLSDFEQYYGGLDQMVFQTSSGTLIISDNYIAQAVRAFFIEGGSACYVSRVVGTTGNGATQTATLGMAMQDTTAKSSVVVLQARFPGFGGNFRVTFVPRLGGALRPNTAAPTSPPTGINLYDSVVVTTSPTAAPTTGNVLSVAALGTSLQLIDSSAATVAFSATTFLRVLTIDVIVEPPVGTARPPVAYGTPIVLTGFGPDPNHSNSIWSYFTQIPLTKQQYLTVPFALVTGATVANPANSDLPTPAVTAGALDIQDLITVAIIKNAGDPNPLSLPKQTQFLMTGGLDGTVPASPDYIGYSTGGTATTGGGPVTPVMNSGLIALEGLDDVSIVAAPGSSSRTLHSAIADVLSIQGSLIAHCEKMLYRVAVLDSQDQMALSDIVDQRSQLSSEYASIYYPWVRTFDPITENEILLPPSGYVCGIYARSDFNYGVAKAPANEVVNLAIGFEFLINKAQQDLLNPLGINCFRYFPGRGYLLWGARTMSPDPLWKYVNVRRYFAYLEHSIDKATQWAVFENNAAPLWKNIESAVADFLYNEWNSGNLVGDKPETSFFVRCDRTTMTQNDLDNGRLICQVGVAPITPAEFVIFRIGQWTATSQS